MKSVINDILAYFPILGSDILEIHKHRLQTLYLTF